MEIGKKIKKLRTSAGITQEKLAEHLNVSFQAVSKWEQGATSPDISLLPLISTYFGITIDDLFTLNEDAHLERIERMLQTERHLTLQDETYASTQLKELLTNPEKSAKAYYLLGVLHTHLAKSDYELATGYIKKALEIDPVHKHSHSVLIESMRGKIWDWNYSNHTKLIDYYKEFTKNNPNVQRGHMYLLDHLIEDGRLEEAKETLKKLKNVEDDFRVMMYEGQIAKAAGDHQKAFELFDKMVEAEPDNWRVWATRADEHARVTNYDQAVKDNLKVLAVQPKPRYIDAHECMSHIYEIKGDYHQAIKAWEDAINVLKTEWNITFGEGIDGPKREIERLKALIN